MYFSYSPPLLPLLCYESFMTHDLDDHATMQTLEISVVSTEGLGKYSSCCCFSRIRPFITLAKLPTQVMYQYDEGGTPEHVFRVPVDPTFFSDTLYSCCLHLQLYNKRRIVGPKKLGWCLIPSSDIGLLPRNSIRYLSYRLRATDGSRGHVIINLSIRLQGSCSSLPWTTSPSLDTCQTVIGIPVTAVRGGNQQQSPEDGDIIINN